MFDVPVSELGRVMASNGITSVTMQFENGTAMAITMENSAIKQVALPTKTARVMSVANELFDRRASAASRSWAVAKRYAQQYGIKPSVARHICHEAKVNGETFEEVFHRMQE